MPKHILTQKQETFCLEYFLTSHATNSAIKAGYSPNTAHVIACENLMKPKIVERIKELREKAESDKVMSVVERKERLSEIARAKLTDFMELGADGSWVNIGPETKNGGAIQEIHSRTEYDENGSKPTVHTSVKLHSPTQAIDLLNKMDKIYSEAPAGGVINNTIMIKVVYEQAGAVEIVDGEKHLLKEGHDSG